MSSPTLRRWTGRRRRLPRVVRYTPELLSFDHTVEASGFTLEAPVGATNAPADSAQADSAQAEGEIRIDEVCWKISKDHFPDATAHKRLRKFYKRRNRLVDALFEEPVDDKDSISDCKSRRG